MRTVLPFLSSKPRATWTIVSLLLLVLIGLNTYISRVTIAELNELNENIRDTADVVTELKHIHLHVLMAESGQRGYLLTRNDSYLVHYNTAIIKIKQGLLRFDYLQQQFLPQASDIDKFYSLVQQKLNELEATVLIAKEGQFTQAIEMVETNIGKAFYEELNRVFTNVSNAADAIDELQGKELEKIIKESQWNLFVFFLISLALVTSVYFLASANIRNQRNRELEMEAQNENLQMAVDERTKELSLFSDELKRSNRELEDFAFVASHDLQEPLRKIMTFGDRLDSQSDNLNDKQRDYLQRMGGAAKRMSVLISDLLEFSRITTRGKTFQEVDLNAVLQHCTDDMNILIEETGVVLDIPHLPTITADSTQMQQLFFNLVANAIKFSQNRDTPKVTIKIETAQQPQSIELEGLTNWVRFLIIDNGIGFEQEYAEKIFAPFQRLHSRNSYKGTGIGLAICRRIVERHNGLICAESESDKGATFSVTLPINNYLISIKH